MNTVRELIFFQSSRYFSAIKHAIAHARKTILIESYIFATDRVGLEILELLKQAAKRKVVVRLMVDGIGSLAYLSHIKNLLRGSNVQFNVFHPLPWQLQQVTWYNLIPLFLIKFIEGFSKINRRNHRKCCLIDEKVLFTGSFNFSSQARRHFIVPQPTDRWCDVGVRVSGYNFSLVARAFKSAWEQHTFRYHHWRNLVRNFKRIAATPIRLNHTWFQRFSLRRDLIKRLRVAKERILITNAYFVPDRRFMRALLAAADAKVEVILLLPNQSDVGFMPLVARVFYDRLLAHNVKVFEYMPAILHAKTLIIDDWAMIGSSNLNYRSLLHDLELDVVLQDAKQKARLLEDFKHKLRKARQVSRSDLTKASIWQRLTGRILLWMRYWL